MRLNRLRAGLRVLVAGVLVGLATSVPAQAQQVNPPVVIAEVYGGGGNTGAPYQNDYVVLFNRSASPLNLTGWSVQYASATGTGHFGGNPVVQVSGTLAPGQYYLVQLAGGANGAALPTPDVTGTINASGTAGKFVLVASSAGLACNGGSTPCSAAQLALIVDLVGWGGANFFETAAAPATNNATAVIRAGSGCTDTNNNTADFEAVTPTPRNTASPFSPCDVADAAPTVTSVSPADGATDVALDANITVTFSEPVNVAGDWFGLGCTVTGTVAATVTGGPSVFTINPAANFVAGETCTLTVFAAQVTDEDTDDPPDNMAADFESSFSTVSADPCALTYTPIYTIQGSGATTPLAGATVTTQGVVVGDYEGPSPALRGFYIQDASGDGDPATSDGIFVFNGNNNSVSLGDVVRVTGTAAEFQGQTQISASAVFACGTGSVTPVDVTFPVSSADYFERYEGMLVRLPQPLSVTEHFQLGRFGQVVLSSGGRLAEPTDVVAPGAPALALQAANDLRRIIIDDDLQNQNRDPIVFARGGLPLSASNTLRGGDTATGIVGVLTYTWAGNAASGNAYRVRPVNALGGSVNFEAANERPTAAPEVGGTLRVAGANLLNYFNTFTGCANGAGGASTGCRGAENLTEFDRQSVKTVAALVGTGADVIGLVELENDGYGPDSAIADLVARLNAATAPGTWAFIDADAGTSQVNALGVDGIKVGIIYKPAMVTPVGLTSALNTTSFVTGGDSAPRNRPALAQAFEQASNGARFVLVVNHLKSKGSACDASDAGDGQGNCNVVRTNAATELATWLAGDPTATATPNVLIVGDLNAYAQEDPLTALGSAGFVNLVEIFLGPDAYTYVFDGQWGSLDHAMATSTLAGRVTGVATVHINADEPNVLDYNTNFKSAGQILSLYAPDAFRAADHDPVVVGLDLSNEAPVITSISDPATIFEGESVLLEAEGYDPDGGPVTYAWDLDDDGVFETSGQTAVFYGDRGVGTFTVTVRVTDQTGLSTTASTTVTVLFTWSGFGAPVRPYPEVNVVRAGAVVPVKFNLGGDKGLDVFAPGFPVSLPVACAPGGLPGTGTPTANPGGSGLSYDPFSGQYTYVWKTERSWAGTCRLLSVMLVDGSTHEALFSFR